MIDYAIKILVIWVILSVLWSFDALGRKNNPSRWYDALLSIPILVIASLIYFIRKIFNKSYREGK